MVHQMPTNAVMYDVAAAMEMLHGQYRSKIIDENQRRLAQIALW